MAGFFQAIGIDLDGTLTRGGRLSVEAMAAIDEARERGMTAVLVTGRILDELTAEYPRLADHFDALVVENGAVVHVGTRDRLRCQPVDASLVAALTQAEVPFRAGRAILACAGADAGVVVEQIARLGLDHQVVHNRAELMVLPAGVSKGTGFRGVLDDLGISAHNTLGIGDAENDLALLEAAELGVAVANAVPSVRQHADLVLGTADGSGVAELLRGPLVGDATVIHSPRHAVRIGQTPAGDPVTVPGARANILIRGASGSGKSRLAGLLMEGWCAAGYTLLVIDPQGDHTGLGRLPNTMVIDVDTTPDAGELLRMLRLRGLSMVLDLSRTTFEVAQGYLHSLAIAVSATRSSYGLPHWVVVDEAQGPLGEQGTLTGVLRPNQRGQCLITYQPEQLRMLPFSVVDLTLTAHGRQPSAGGRPVPATASVGTPDGVTTTVLLDERATPHVRHRHKYAQSLLPVAQHFVFRDRYGHPLSTAASMEGFVGQLAKVSTESIEHHAVAGDFSRWVADAIQDPQLGLVVAVAEGDLTARRVATAEAFRRHLLREITDRYLSENPAGA